ncbi:MAG: response regulator [Lentisphaerae bacterium]|nr:response regulator [Lentisphaerota bacterium]
MGTVLIIDDESVIRDYLATLIRRLGHEPVTAATAMAGLEKLADPDCQLVIADIFLPDSPPPEIWIQQLAQTAAGRMVVLISGAPSQELNECATASGITTFLSKPFELTFIRRILQTAFN